MSSALSFPDLTATFAAPDAENAADLDQISKSNQIQSVLENEAVIHDDDDAKAQSMGDEQAYVTPGNVVLSDLSLGDTDGSADEQPENQSEHSNDTDQAVAFCESDEEQAVEEPYLDVLQMKIRRLMLLLLVFLRTCGIKADCGQLWGVIDALNQERNSGVCCLTTLVFTLEACFCGCSSQVFSMFSLSFGLR